MMPTNVQDSRLGRAQIMKAEQIGIGIYGECRHFGKGKKKDEGNEGFMRFDACCAGIVRLRRGKEKRGGGVQGGRAPLNGHVRSHERV